jgi:hypothetical protein
MTTIEINRAPVMTLWAAVVAERLGYKRAEALTLGRAVAGMNAQSKALHLGIRERSASDDVGAPEGGKPKRKSATDPQVVLLLGRAVPVVQTAKGVRSVSKDGKTDSPEAVEKYLAGKFGDALEAARAAMEKLAAAHSSDDLAAKAYALYEKFRPAVPPGTTGWGAKGVLDLAGLAKLAPKKAKRD